MRHIAIIGSGPSGCYVADSLLKLLPDASIDVIERLPVPFGLVRYGVAPDHQGTKGVARVLDRILGRDRVAFLGNVAVGRDVQLDELLALYDAVVLATGASRDRRLGIPGEDLPGVIGSGAFVGWYNGHPEGMVPPVQKVRSAVVIGNGNVALDVARILAKGSSEFAGSDLPHNVSSSLGALPIESIHIVGRRSAAEARFSEHELAELGTLVRAQPEVEDSTTLIGDGPIVKTLLGFAAVEPNSKPVTMRFHFNLTPTAFLGDQKLRSVEFKTSDGRTRKIPAELAVTCIGYETLPCADTRLANGVFDNQDGKIDDGLYVVGWAKRGPSGTIPTNRAEAQQVAQRIATEVDDHGRAGGAALRELFSQRGVCWVDYSGWRRIDAAEVAARDEQQCRRKLLSIEEMLNAAKAEQAG